MLARIVGRVRPLERTALNPAVTWAFGNAELPFPVASVTRWQDTRPDRLARMVAHGAVWLNAEDAHAFEAGMFRSAKAAEHVRGRVADARDAVRAIACAMTGGRGSGCCTSFADRACMCARPWHRRERKPH